MTLKLLPVSGTMEAGRTRCGVTIYREPNGVGGHRYWCDSMDGGVMIWDTCMVSIEELELAIRVEKEHAG